MESESKEKPRVIHYTVNDENQETTEREMTPVAIMTKAGVDPAQNYLLEIVGRERKSYQNDPNAKIHMHEKQRFATVFVGTVPVS